MTSRMTGASAGTMLISTSPAPVTPPSVNWLRASTEPVTGARTIVVDVNDQRLAFCHERMGIEVRFADPTLVSMAGDSKGALGRGGMRTKLNAAYTAARSGAATVIAHGRKPDALLSMASSQLELKSIPGAKKTLNELITKYPDSPAAASAKTRLNALK